MIERERERERATSYWYTCESHYLCTLIKKMNAVSTKIIKLPGCQDARMPGCQDARMQGCQDATMQLWSIRNDAYPVVFFLVVCFKTGPSAFSFLIIFIGSVARHLMNAQMDTSDAFIKWTRVTFPNGVLIFPVVVHVTRYVTVTRCLVWSYATVIKCLTGGVVGR